MYVTPEFGSGAWIMEHCSATALYPDMIMGLMIAVVILGIIMFFVMLMQNEELKNVKNFLKENKLLQKYAESKKE